MKNSLKNYFITGLIIIVPIAVTFWITYSLLLWLDEIYFFEKWLGVSVPGLGLLITLAAILLTGFLGKNVLGNWMVDQVALIVDRIPVVGAIYGSLRQVMNSLVNQKGDRLGRAVMVEFPREGSWSIGFMTAKETPPPLRKHFQEKMVCVFVPTTPNPTSGFFFLVPEKNVRFLDIPTDEAFKIVVSLGLASRDRGGVVPPIAGG
ncbi:MAG TPA: DUF502 domain-containing protein [Bdellovibrionales bacterium]|nr:DUF502 domain-containing protein [Bdellovibrionales bacterium]